SHTQQISSYRCPSDHLDPTLQAAGFVELEVVGVNQGQRPFRHSNISLTQQVTAKQSLGQWQGSSVFSQHSQKLGAVLPAQSCIVQATTHQVSRTHLFNPAPQVFREGSRFQPFKKACINLGGE